MLRHSLSLIWNTTGLLESPNSSLILLILPWAPQSEGLCGFRSHRLKSLPMFFYATPQKKFFEVWNLPWPGPFWLFYLAPHHTLSFRQTTEKLLLNLIGMTGEAGFRRILLNWRDYIKSFMHILTFYFHLEHKNYH